jgi:hypothetical protein
VRIPEQIQKVLLLLIQAAKDAWMTVKNIEKADMEMGKRYCLFVKPNFVASKSSSLGGSPCSRRSI